MSKQIHIKLPNDLHQALRLLAAASDTTVQDYVLAAIRRQISGDRQKLEEVSESVARVAEEVIEYEPNRDLDN